MSAPLRLRVVSFNIHGGRPKAGPPDISGTAGVLRRLGADVVGLQEVHRCLPPPGAFQDQPRRLLRVLGMRVTFLPSLGLGPWGYGNAILSHLAPESVQGIRLPGRGEPRALLEARFDLGGRSLHFLNTHLGLSAEQRQEQVLALAARLRAARGPVVAVGDWNAPPHGPEVRRLEAEGLICCGAADLLTFPSDRPRLRLDYIMVSRHFRVERCYTLRTRASDHLPLVADLRLEQSG